MSPSVLSAEQLLLHFAVPGWPGVFTLGALERRANLVAQQSRAFNLAFALRETGAIAADSRVAVVGAGAAGLTCSAALGKLGIHVDVLERATEPIQLIADCSTRYLHPNLLDWPNDRWHVPTTRLPLMNWSAGTAADVASELLLNWTKLRDVLPISISCNTQGLQLSPQSGSRKVVVNWNTSAFHSETFDAVVLAVGFGRERGLEEQGLAGYWRDDDLHQLHEMSSDAPRDVFISGCGDGGLADLRRAALGVAGIKEILSVLLTPETTDSLRDPVNRAEEFLGTDAASDGAWKLYSSLPRTEINDKIEHWLRRDTAVVLHGRTSDPLSSNAYPLNRYIASRLLGNSVKYVFGGFEVERLAGKFLIAVNGATPRAYDRLVLRHGPVPALETSFPAIWQAIQDR